ncbi:MAG: SpoIIE family protein phosphatase [Rhodothermales bacterium]
MPSKTTIGPAEASFDALDAIETISRMLLASHFDPEALLKAITDVTVRKMKVKGCVLRMLNADTGELSIRSVTGLSERFLFSAPVIDIKNRFQSLIQQEGVYSLYDVRAGSDLQFSEAALEEGISSLLAVGLFEGKKVVGSLSIYTDRPVRFTRTHTQTLRVLARYAVMALELARLHRSELQLKLQSRDLAIAASIQQRMLPSVIPDADDIQLAVRMSSWYEVGGDFYDVSKIDRDTIGLAIGEVAGKGMPAALLMSGALMAYRSQMGNSRQLPEIVGAVNDLLTRDTRTEEYASLICCRLDLDEFILCYVNAGHMAPLLFRKGRVTTLTTGGMTLGICAGLTYEQGVLQLEKDDVVVFRTDGCTRATRADGQVFGERRFRRAIRSQLDASAARIADSVQAALRSFVGDAGLRDDQTVIVLRVE